MIIGLALRWTATINLSISRKEATVLTAYESVIGRGHIFMIEDDKEKI